MLKKVLFLLGLFLAPFVVFAAVTVPWNRTAVGTITPLYSGDGALINASSTIGAGGQATGLTISGGATTTGQLFVAAGSLSAPSIAFAGTTNNKGGFYDAGVGSISIGFNGTQTHTFWSDGSFYLGGTVPELKLPSGGWQDWNADTYLSRQAAGVLRVGTTNADANGTILAGKEGIGTTSPFALLTVEATSTTGIGSPTTLFAISSTTGGLSTSTLFAVTNAGKVGIGTNAPAELLDVQGNIVVPTGNAYRFGNSSVQMFRASTPVNSLSIAASGGVNFTGNSNVAVLFGNLGAGSSSPAFPLSVHARDGQTYSGNTLFAIGSSTASATTTLFSVSNTGAVTQGATTFTGGASFPSASTVTYYTMSSLIGTSGINAGGGIWLATAAAMAFGGNFAGPFLAYGGNATTLNIGGINSASPIAQTFSSQGSRPGTDSDVGGANLTIRSGGGTGIGTLSSLIFQTPVAVGSGTGAQTQTTAMTITNGNVGVGTTTPPTKLSVMTEPAGNGTIATTTVDFGDYATTTSTACFNTKNTAGTAISFYFVGVAIVVEANRCR